MDTGWSAVAEAPLSERYSATVVWVADRFLVVGGDDGPRCPPTADCAVPMGSFLRDGAAFDPVSGTWAPIADSPALVVFPSTAVIDAVLYVLTASGYAGAPSAFLAYDATADTWSTLPMPPDGPGNLVVAGDVLLSIPGSDETGPAVDSWFDPQTASWHRVPDDPLGLSFDRTLVVVDGRMFLTARDLVARPGADAPSLVRLAELDSTMESWTVLPGTEVIGSGPVSAGGRLVFPDPGGSDGGEVGNWGRAYPFGGIYEPRTGEWERLPETPGDSSWPRLVVGDLVRVGDSLLDPVTLTTTAIPDEPWDPNYPPSIAASPSALFAWGGLQDGTAGWLSTP
ncbi:Kelch repeat-containing protein [Pengzhenrongella sicca]|uniref:Galactose oxidase n=1 Tax=Pengzhenrongella sicca TaxID=2819238 RepID=A0A8A4ZEE7_9MICO|nr:hypothetical protein [Pengzhenrongella sicca]QTE30352.1 hypothetical protein J4E96_04965 [Pengzhenrongella sicca]